MRGRSDPSSQLALRFSQYGPVVRRHGGVAYVNSPRGWGGGSKDAAAISPQAVFPMPKQKGVKTEFIVCNIVFLGVYLVGAGVSKVVFPKSVSPLCISSKEVLMCS